MNVCVCLKCLCAAQFSFFMLSYVKMHVGADSEVGFYEMLMNLSCLQYLQYMHITFISVHVINTVNLLLNKFLQI